MKERVLKVGAKTELMQDLTLNGLVERVASLVAKEVLLHLTETLESSIHKEFTQNEISSKRAEASSKEELGDVYLTASELIKKLNISRSTLYRLTEAKKIPGPRQVSPRRVAWLRSEIEEWMITR